MQSVIEAVNALAQGKMIIIVDDEERENEGDVAMAADLVTSEAINFMATHARGLICVPVIGERLDELQLPPMVEKNTATLGTAFTVSVEAIGRGVTTGISAYDRATTAKLLTDPKARPEDFARPGHTFPLRARSGGVLERAGQTEAIIDLCRLADRFPAGVICEVIRDDGEMARRDDLKVFAVKHQLPLVTISDLKIYLRTVQP